MRNADRPPDSLHFVIENVQRDDDPRTDLAELCVELALRTQRVCRRDNRPQFESCVVGDHEVRHIGQEEHDTIALADPEEMQTSGQALGQVMDLAPTHCVSLEDKGRSFALALCHLV